MNGGSAFPRTAHPCMTYEDLGADGADPHDGMSLREWFAGLAMNALAAHSMGIHNAATIKALALTSYRIADAMIRARHLPTDSEQ